MTYLGIALSGLTALALSTALSEDRFSSVASKAIGSTEVSPLQSQEKKAPKRPPLIPPKRLVAVQFIDIKLTKGSSPNTVGFGFGAGNTSGGGAQSDGDIVVTNTANFAAGMGNVMITSLTDSNGFLVVDLPATPSPGTDPEGETPELVLRAVITDMSCRKRSGGLLIGDLSGGQGQYENKVTMDVRLVDPATNLVVDSVKATGRKTSKSSIFGATKYSSLNTSTKILDLSYRDFEDSPLSEAARLATQDAVKKLIEKAQKRPWEARVVKVVVIEEGYEFYLNVDGDCGLQEGDQLELLQLGDPLIDPKTNRALGRARKAVGTVIVIAADGESVLCRLKDSASKSDLEDPAKSLIVRQRR